MALLLNQSFIAGIGNIYADEILYAAAKVHPLAIASGLSKPRVARVHQAMREVLSARDLEHGGSSISDYVNAAGERGWFQMMHNAYGREGEPCLRCGAPIRKILVALQRGTHFCAKCQKRSNRSSRRRSTSIPSSAFNPALEDDGRDHGHPSAAATSGVNGFHARRSPHLHRTVPPGISFGGPRPVLPSNCGPLKRGGTSRGPDLNEAQRGLPPRLRTRLTSGRPSERGAPDWAIGTRRSGECISRFATGGPEGRV